MPRLAHYSYASEYYQDSDWAELRIFVNEACIEPHHSTSDPDGTRGTAGLLCGSVTIGSIGGGFGVKDNSHSVTLSACAYHSVTLHRALPWRTGLPKYIGPARPSGGK